jgi:hypothetical protein
MTHSLSRRSFAAGGLAAMLATRIAWAQDDGDGLDGLDLPTLDISVTTSGFGGVPEETEAGRYLLTVSLEDGLERGGVGFVRPPEELTADQFVLELQAASEVVPQDADTPEPESTSGRPPVGAPVVAYDATFAGGVIASGDRPGRAVIELDEGEWVIWAADILATQAPLIVTVSGQVPEDAAEPDADAEITLAGGSVGIDASLPAGEHLLRIAHEGGEPHAFELLRGPDDMSEDDLQIVLRARWGAVQEDDADALPFDPENDLQTVLATAAQSEGTVQWVQASLEPGTYAAICTFPGMEDALPHALHGEYAIVTVE